jgi:hypothetical protein
MSLTSRLSVSFTASQKSAAALGTADLPIQVARALAFADGSGANQASKLFTDRRTLAASGTEDIDLAGVLADPFGATVTFAKIRAMFIAADPANTNNVVVGGAASNGFLGWVADATDKIVVGPGGLFVIAKPDLAGYSVTAGTGDLLHVANSGGVTGVTYDLVLVGS